MSLVERKRKIHFVGLGGIGMSGIAELLLALGHEVSGSDLAESETLARLKSLGARTQVPHGDKILQDYPPDVVVYSTAVHATNPELVYARAHKIPIIRRAEMLAELMRLKRGIAIAGSHGKTTTTGLAAMLLKAGGLDPTVVIGGRFSAIGSNAALGVGKWLVAEADESDGSFLRLSPELAVVTNIDHEHLDHYKRFEGVLNAFEEFIDKVPFYGRAILCSDCEYLRGMQARMRKPVVFYGLEKKYEPDYWLGLVQDGAQPEFEVRDRASQYQKVWLKFKLSVPGLHNGLNALAAALVAFELEISKSVIEKTLSEFNGVERRFQRRGRIGPHEVIEDYAHHPTEIRATLQAARSAFPQQKIWVAFQPHRYSRTRDSWADFKNCFQGADRVFTLPIYAASEVREAWVENYDGEAFAQHLEQGHGIFCPTREVLTQRIREELGGEKAPVAVLILGAGDIAKVIAPLLGT